MLLAIVVADALLVLFLVGSWSVTGQARRVLDDDTLEGCAVALAAAQGGSWLDYRLGDAGFGGPNVLEASYRRAERAGAGRPAPTGPASGTVRCAVEARGDTVDDPLTVVDVSVPGSTP